MSKTASQSFWDHFAELRVRVLWSVGYLLGGFFLAYGFHKQIFQLLRYPFDQAYFEVLQKQPILIQTNLLEAFIVYIKLSLLTGLFIACPFIFYQLWKFIAPGLRKSEKKHVFPFVLMASLLFIGGALFGYFAVFPKGFAFFLSITADQNIEAMIKMQDYFALAAWMLLGFGISFEMPLITMYLIYFGILSRKTLIASWRGVIVGIVVFSAIITPTPDPGTLMMMSFPLIGLYGLTIVFSYFIEDKKKKTSLDQSD